VPDQLHRKLKVRAAEHGVSLSDYILVELRRLSERITPQELAERARHIVRQDFSPSPVDVLHAERAERARG
jgi:plasmid stability protein